MTTHRTRLTPNGRATPFLSPFAFLDPASTRQERLAAYIRREHRRERPLREILNDPYLRSRCTQSQLELLIENPDLVHQLADDIAARGGLSAQT
jgi:hypothetical protein